MLVLKTTLTAILFQFATHVQESSPFSQSIASSTTAKNLDNEVKKTVSVNPEQSSLSKANKNNLSNVSLNDLLPEHVESFRHQLQDRFGSAFSDPEHSFFYPLTIDYMISLYKYKSGEPSKQKRIDAKSNNALRRSNTVRSFEALEQYVTAEKLSIFFDISVISPHERIKLAELRMDKIGTLTEIDIWEERKIYERNVLSLIRKKIGTVPLKRNSTLNFTNFTIDVTRLLRRWFNNFHKNNEFEKSRIDVNREDLDSDYDKLSSAPLERRSVPESRKEILLFVYSSHNDLDLIDVATSRRDRTRRASKHVPGRSRLAHRRRHSRRKNRRKNKTERPAAILETLHNDVEAVHYRNQQGIEFSNELEQKTLRRHKSRNDDLSAWQDIQKPDVVILNKEPKRKANIKPTPPLTITSATTTTTTSVMIVTSRNSTKRYNHTYCRKVDYEIDFEKIGWDDWILHPRRFNAYRCVGECKATHAGPLRPTNHAFIQSVLVSSHNRHVSSPCCIPTKLSPLSILFYNNDMLQHSEHKDVIVDECDCR